MMLYRPDGTSSVKALCSVRCGDLLPRGKEDEGDEEDIQGGGGHAPTKWLPWGQPDLLLCPLRNGPLAADAWSLSPPCHEKDPPPPRPAVVLAILAKTRAILDLFTNSKLQSNLSLEFIPSSKMEGDSPGFHRLDIVLHPLYTVSH